MRRIALVWAVLLASPAATEPALEGRWITEPGPGGRRAVVEIAPCGVLHCGRIVALPDGGDPARLGVDLVRGLRTLRGERIAVGEILFPRLGRWFVATVNYGAEDALVVSGCLAPGLFCRAQRWVREEPSGRR